MQHTKFDRWLCRKFVHINRIYFDTMPEGMPRDLDILESDEESGARYKYRGTTRDEKLAHEVCDIFVSQNIIYTGRVDEVDSTIARFIKKPERSITMMIFWICLGFIGAVFALSGIPQTLMISLLSDRDAVKAQDKIDREDRVRAFSNKFY